MTEKVKIVAPISTIKGRTRIYKLVLFLCRERISYSFWGWERVPGEAEDEIQDGALKEIILKGGGYGTRLTKAFYLLWMFKVFIKALFARKIKLYHCLGFESAFPLWVVKKFRDIEYIYDDADRFSMLLGRGRHVVARLEQLVSRDARKHIVPNISRYQDFTDTSKFIEIKNLPDSGEVDKALRFDMHSMLEELGVTELEGKIVVYVNGWLSEIRGLGVIDHLSSILSQMDSKVIFLLAGKKSADISKEMSRRANVFYLGELENHISLAVYKISDFVFTYYDPRQVINRYAESNKWGDALTMGTPIIVNKEVVTAKDLIDSKYAVAFQYNDESALAHFLSDYMTAKSVHDDMREKIITGRVGMLSYDEALSAVFI